MKTMWKIFWGVGFVLIAVVLILDALGILKGIMGPFGEVSIFALAISLLLLSYVISRIIRLKFEEIFVPLSFIFMLLEGNIAHLFGLEDPDIINNWLLFGCAVLLWIGFSILCSGIKRKNKKKSFEFIYNGGERGAHNSGNIGSSVKYINCESFRFESIENNFGHYTVHFDNVEKYEGGAVLEVENNFGSLTVNVPSEWNIKMDIDNSFGGTTVPNGGNANGPDITIKGENNFGKVSVEYV